MVYFAIHSVGDERDLRILREFLLGQALWYPDYAQWVETVCIPDIDNGWKKAIVARDRSGAVVGNAVFQPHKELSRTRELKNIRIHPGSRGRDLGHFLLRQAEEEDAVVDGQRTFDMIIADTDIRSRDMIGLLAFSGYQEIFRRPLYAEGNVDMIMVKHLPYRDPLLTRLTGRN